MQEKLSKIMVFGANRLVESKKECRCFDKKRCVSDECSSSSS